MHASRPLIALLVGTVAFFALWVVALKPSSSGSGGSHSSLGQYGSAISRACSVPGLQHPAGCSPPGKAPPTTRGAAGAPQTHGGTAGAGATAGATSTTGQSGSRPGNAVKPGRYVEPAHRSVSTPKSGFAAVQAALEAHKVLALLFYNPAAADDQAVHQELAAVPTHRGAVVKLAVPLQDLSSYSTLLNQVPVNFSPTLVLINRLRQASEIAGFADTFEIDERVASAVN